MPAVSSDGEECYEQEEQRLVNSVWDISDGFAEEAVFERRVGP